MTLWTIIPTCDDLMSIYTLCGFVIYSCILLVVGRIGYVRMEKIDTDAKATLKTINEMHTDMAVMKESLKNIESDGVETRAAMAAINQTLLDKLT